MLSRAIAPLLALLALTASAGRAVESPVALTGTVRAAGQAVGNAVVWIEGATGSARRPRAGLHQRSLKFAPQVLAVRTGTVVDFPNEDRFSTTSSRSATARSSTSASTRSAPPSR